MAFDITQMVSSVSDEEEKFKITEIDIDKIVTNERNFYNTNEIQNLKAGIKALGLEHNLTVAKKDEVTGTYKLISGHRRFKAIQELIAEGELNIKTVPCKIDNRSELERRLALIVLNATAREISPAEKMKQVEELKAIAKELKSNKETKFTGKIRDYIADTLNMSTGEVARYEAISNNLDETIKDEFTQDNISTDTAYEISKLDKEEQEEVVEIIKEAKAENKKITTKDVKDISQKKEKQTQVTDISDWEFDNQMDISDVSNIIVQDNENIDTADVQEGISSLEYEENGDITQSSVDIVENNNINDTLYVRSKHFKEIGDGLRTFQIIDKGRCKVGDTIEFKLLGKDESEKSILVKITYISFEDYFSEYHEVAIFTLI